MSLPNPPDTLEEAIKIIDILYQNLVEDTARMKKADEMVKSNRKISDRLLESVENIFGTIGKVKKIASQTKLLAINAGIEAAQAGESGRGFLIVAEEVKELSKQTSAATTAISKEISEIQSAADAAAASLKEMVKEMDAVRNSNYEIFDMLEARSRPQDDSE
ncbi:MAG: hypothetical protein HQL75_08165 [Magnetococcales bacterium]|nr:hypothetical protein [Magnetococcales bacterium]